MYYSGMIGHLHGSILQKSDKHIILDVHDVGYKVYVSLDTIAKLSGVGTVSLWIHTIVREDALDLYGFMSEQELTFFKLVIGISGIGPKSALGIMNVAPIGTLIEAIGSGDTSYLTKVSGIGKKMAQKIVLELKDKVGLAGNVEESTSTRHEDLDVLEALKSLGYREYEAREVLKELPQEITGTSQKITEALRRLGKE